MSSTLSGYSTRARVEEAGAGLDLTLLIARLLLVVIFPISAYYKVIQWPGIVTMLEQQAVPLPLYGGALAVGVEVIGALLVALGLWTRIGAILLILYVAGATAVAHRFWEFAMPAQFAQMMSFFKNLAMIGGLLLIAVLGPGRFAVQPRS
jgi:putative oxidoreductase